MIFGLGNKNNTAGSCWEASQTGVGHAPPVAQSTGKLRPHLGDTAEVVPRIFPPILTGRLFWPDLDRDQNSDIGPTTTESVRCVPLTKVTVNGVCTP